MKKRALFVGVDEYEDGSIADLEYAVEDAYGLAAAFETLLGFDRVEKLRNPAGKKDILGKVSEVTDGLKKGDLFFFFFAGHGFRVKENHVLVCKKDLYADLEDEYDGLPMGQLKKRMRGPWDRMLVIDACQNDIRKTRGAEEGMSGRDLALILGDGARDADDPDLGGEGVEVVVASCSARQKALEVDELKHGLFTSALLETVQEHARMRTRLDLAGFRAEMGTRMGALAKKYRLRGKQNPMFKIPGECGVVLLEGEDGARRDGGRESREEVAALAELARLRAELERLRAEKREEGAGTPVLPVFGGPEARRAGETKRIVLPGGAEMELAWCPPGTFMMGSPEEEEGRHGDETQHRVTLSKGFWMARTPVTQRQWKSVMGCNPANHKGDDLPVEMVNWNECCRFCEKAGLALPTEAEWEYAGRAGITGPHGGGGRLEEIAWYGCNSNFETHSAGQKGANAWGLNDMAGNVWEWCADVYQADLGRDAETDPTGPVSGVFRVLRGGGYLSEARDCRFARRDYLTPGNRGGSIGCRPLLRER